MLKYQIFVYRFDNLIWISQPHSHHQAQSTANNWRSIGYGAEVRPVEGHASLRICDHPEPSNDVIHCRRLKVKDAISRLWKSEVAQ